MTECSHAPRQVSGEFGVGFLTANGNWWLERRGARGLYAEAVTHCPGCGTALWGLPAQAVVVMPGMASAGKYEEAD